MTPQYVNSLASRLSLVPSTSHPQTLAVGRQRLRINRRCPAPRLLDLAARALPRDPIFIAQELPSSIP